ncbi:hypothetical protein DPM19_29560 [Actinomadura craniellae]|uniref:Tetratricopeptide repeat protein n=2 Tax=Actinomadura craniellae TaxID=2231787 RepID=A0A365GX97_9ACTN|nr:hypothetical protein DPM19_29560 [Actinomadura craniellae]
MIVPIGVVASTFLSLGVEWVRDPTMWSVIWAFALLAGFFAVWDGGGLAIGDDWLRHRRRWVNTHELVAVRMAAPKDAMFGLIRTSLDLVLVDRAGRRVRVLLGKLEAHEELRELVGEAIRRAVQKGDAAIEDRVRWRFLPEDDEQSDPVVIEYGLGAIAHERGEHATALAHYEKSRSRAEERADRRRRARADRALGILLTETEETERAVGHTMRALMVHAELDHEEVEGDLAWLARQRRVLGDARFTELLHKETKKPAVHALLGLLDARDGR